MFNWFWDFLYSISEILFELVDGVVAICNKLCGIEPIQVAGKDTNFLVSLLKDPRIFLGFAGAVLIGIFLLMIFGAIAICRNCNDGKKSNAQIAVQVFKTLGMFFIVPTLMIGFTVVINQLVIILYRATSATQTSIGGFLFSNFLPSGMQGYQGSVDWKTTSDVRSFMANAGYNLSDYRFFFSWLVTLPLLICIARSMMMFISRTITIVILFIMSPISMSTAVLDDGARFKTWRDKVISNYLAGYGMVLAINIYILLLAFITRSDVVFIKNAPIISDTLANFLLKIAFALGGAFFLPKVFGLIGDLFTQGGGSNEWRNFEEGRRENEGMLRYVGGKIFSKDKNKQTKDQEAAARKAKMDQLEKSAEGDGQEGSSGNGNPLPDLGAGGNKQDVKDIIQGENQNNQNNSNDFNSNNMKDNIQNNSSNNNNVNSSNTGQIREQNNATGEAIKKVIVDNNSNNS